MRRYGAGRFAAVLPLALGSPRCGGALAHARFAASGGALATLGSPLRGGALARARFAALGGALAPLGLPLGAALSLRPVRRVAALSLRSVRRFGAALPLALGSPRWAALSLRSVRRVGRRSRSRPVRRFGRRSRSRPGGFYLINIYLNRIINQSRRRREAPAFRFGWRSRSARFGASVRRSRSARLAAWGGAPAHARFAASVRRSRSRPVRRVGRRRSRSRSAGFYLINIYLNIIINQSRRRREAPAFRTAKKIRPLRRRISVIRYLFLLCIFRNRPVFFQKLRQAHARVGRACGGKLNARHAAAGLAKPPVKPRGGFSSGKNRAYPAVFQKQGNIVRHRVFMAASEAPSMSHCARTSQRAIPWRRAKARRSSVPCGTAS